MMPLAAASFVGAAPCSSEKHPPFPPLVLSFLTHTLCWSKDLLLPSFATCSAPSLESLSSGSTLEAALVRQLAAHHPRRAACTDRFWQTGWNIEQMAEYFPLDQISQIYLIDLCEPLLEVARQRFAARGLKNVQVLCQDAKEFMLPGLADDQKVDLFTCSYSISMVRRINNFCSWTQFLRELLSRFLPSMPFWTASTISLTLRRACLASLTSMSRAVALRAGTRAHRSVVTTGGTVAGSAASFGATGSSSTTSSCTLLAEVRHSFLLIENYSNLALRSPCIIFSFAQTTLSTNLARSSASMAATTSSSRSLSACESQRRWLSLRAVAYQASVFSSSSPYYIWLGCSRSRDTTDAIQAFEVEAGNRVIVPPSFPELSFSHLLSASKTQILTEKSGQDSAVASAHTGVLTDPSNLVKRRGSETNSTSSSASGFKIDLGPQVPLSSFHYQKRQWRLPYSELLPRNVDL